MDTNGETRYISNKDYPAVAAWTVSLIFPFQDEPEHQGSEERGEGIDLSLDCRKPEGVAESIGHSTHQSAGLNQDDLV